MKITVNVDATPQELRTFFGLPDVEPLQQEMLGALREKMLQGIEEYDPAVLLKPLLPEHMQNWEAMRKFFWESFAQGTEGSGKGGGKPGKQE